MTTKVTAGTLSRTTLFLATLCLGTAGCGAQDTTSPAQPAVGKVSAAQTVLATVTTGDGREIKFIGLAPDDVVIAEKYEEGQEPVLEGDAINHKSLSDLYRVVEPSSEVPKALVDAQARIDLARSSAPPTADIVAIPKTAVTAPSEGQKFYTAGEQAAFAQKYCTASASFCEQFGPTGPAIYATWLFNSHLNANALVQSDSPNGEAFFSLTQWECGSTCSEVVLYQAGLFAGEGWNLLRVQGHQNWMRADLVGEFGAGGAFSLEEEGYETF